MVINLINYLFIQRLTHIYLFFSLIFTVRNVLNPDNISDEVYLKKMENILAGTQFIGVPPEPTLIFNNVYLGTQVQAENLDLLRRLKIKFVFNCAGLPESNQLRASRAARYKGTGIEYGEIPADDVEGYPIIRDFGSAHAFIESAHYKGRVLIHCTGVSRSGAIALGFLIRMGRRLLEATQDLKNSRRVVICNFSFMKQIVEFARIQGMLDPEPENVRAPNYYRRLNRRRINSAHLPLVL